MNELPLNTTIYIAKSLRKKKKKKKEHVTVSLLKMDTKLLLLLLEKIIDASEQERK